MEESTLTVLRTVKGIQFDGRPDPRKIEIGLCGASAKSKLNPVPYVAIAAELWGKDGRLLATSTQIVWYKE